MKKNHNRGMTLVEVAISIAILGILLAGGMTVYNSAENQRKTKLTQERMDTIARALSTYVESAARLPCPSDPASPKNPIEWENILGWENGVGVNSTKRDYNYKLPRGFCDNVAEQSEGVVPYLSLNIPIENMQDGWGNYFTYAISPVFAGATDSSDQGAEWVPPQIPGTPHMGRFAAFAPVKNSNIIPAAYLPYVKRGLQATQMQLVNNELGIPVSNLCRSRDWVKNNDNINGPKAKFCCAWMEQSAVDKASDIVMYLTTDATQTPLTGERNDANYNNIQDEYTDGSGNPAPVPLSERDDVTIPAFVLISHGPNGYGAYRVNETRDRIPFDVPAGSNTFERLNADNDTENKYYTGPANRAAGPNYFDDIVMWRTQFGIMAYNGTSSCALP